MSIVRIVTQFKLMRQLKNKFHNNLCKTSNSSANKLFKFFKINSKKTILKKNN